MRRGMMTLTLAVSLSVMAIGQPSTLAAPRQYYSMRAAARGVRQGGALPAMVRGTVAKISGTEVDVTTGKATVHVRLSPPFRVYGRVPGRLADVKSSSFVGVTSVKQPDGTEKATEIHIFPPELRGMGEGSHMMSPSPNPTPSRMTNGSVSASRMTKSPMSKSRMSNGSVQRTGSSSIIVKYQGGSQTIAVPPGVTVTELKLSPTKLRVGDNVVFVVQKDSHGTLSSKMAIRSGG